MQGSVTVSENSMEGLGTKQTSISSHSITPIVLYTKTAAQRDKLTIYDRH